MDRSIAILLVAFAVFVGCSAPEVRRDDGTSVETATLRQHMLDAFGAEQWRDTAAIRFRWSAPMQIHGYLWDRERRYVEVRWTSYFSNYIVRYDLETRQGLAFEDQEPVVNRAEVTRLITQAHGYFTNDAFWLNPLLHIDSPGAVLSATPEGYLMVHYEYGGETPGDTYVFRPRADGLIAEMEVWAGPFLGADAAFTQYEKSETGVWVAGHRSILGISIEVSDVEMMAEYPPEGDRDRFRDLEALLAE